MDNHQIFNLAKLSVGHDPYLLLLNLGPNIPGGRGISLVGNPKWRRCQEDIQDQQFTSWISR